METKVKYELNDIKTEDGSKFDFSVYANSAEEAKTKLVKYLQEIIKILST